MIHRHLTYYIAPALAVASLAVADIIPNGDGAHFFSLQNMSLVFGPEVIGIGPEIKLVMQLPGSIPALDSSIFFPNFGQGVPGPLVSTDFCISSAGVEVGSFTDANGLTLFISDSFGNCLTLFPENAVLGGPVTLAACQGELLGQQEWDPIVVDFP
ncbi:hypothetical protein PYCCODRAFT_1471120 [Trametes coccinea BRFM310]|uniref:Ricin B lectin domain-containing protein n=1 Tax=Trametes coccinea (strain BRFM310) TaxID=1353009 RepID=A0A1Y2IB36_TRAC3|nr:hypothetical protein PYCCODRAFT_1471120 [Trametes coccinea BRFM310]